MITRLPLGYVWDIPPITLLIGSLTYQSFRTIYQNLQKVAKEAYSLLFSKVVVENEVRRVCEKVDLNTLMSKI